MADSSNANSKATCAAAAAGSSNAVDNPREFYAAGIEKYECELRRLGELDDPLSVFDAYYAYLLGTHADALTMTRILERATQTFVDDRRYRNDPRYLRLWLAYALRCREPEDIYAFLAMRAIAADLAAYYEEYAFHLASKGDILKALAILKAGVDRSAQPLERLTKRLHEFSIEHKLTSSTSNGGKRGETSGYKIELIANGNLSFEEVRARSWRRAGGILKASYYNPPPIIAPNQQTITPSPTIDNFEEFELGLGPIDPDELTQISVYRDNTTDLRELARSLDNNKKINSTTDVIKEEGGEGRGNITNSTLLVDSFAFEDFIIGGGAKGLVGRGGQDCRNPRLSLIPEESDGTTTTVSGLIPKLLSQKGQVYKMGKVLKLTLSQMEQRQAGVSVDGAVKSKEMMIQPRLAAMAKSIGRDGVGNNNTVASLRIATGHYFIERRLGENVVLAVDLEADLSNSDLHQSALKVVPNCWEPFILCKLSGITGVPKLGKVCQYPDSTIFTLSYFAHGSLAKILTLNPTIIDEKLIMFWTRELICTVSQIHQRNIIHGGITLEHILIRLGPQPLTTQFDPTGGGGWNDRGISLVSFSHSLQVNDRDGDMGGAEYLDNDLLERFRNRLQLQDLPGRIKLLDIVGIFNVVSLLHQKLVGTLKHKEMWSRVKRIFEEVITNDNKVTTAAADDDPFPSILIAYEKIITILDNVLVSESIVLPTLKSLLTKLEISLLERPPQ